MLSHGLPKGQNSLAKNRFCSPKSSLTPQSPPENRRLKTPQISVPDVVVGLAEEWKFKYFWVKSERFWFTNWRHWSRGRYRIAGVPRIEHEVLKALIERTGQADGKLITHSRKIQKLLQVVLEINPLAEDWDECHAQQEDQSFLIRLREDQANG